MKPDRYILKAQRALKNMSRVELNHNRRRQSYWTRQGIHYFGLFLTRSTPRLRELKVTTETILNNAKTKIKQDRAAL